MMVRKTALAAMLFTATVWAQSSKATDHYLLILPAGWMQVSAESAKLLAEDLHFTSMPHANQKFAYLYQRTSRDSLFTLPYMLVQVNDGQRLTENELKSFSAYNYNYDSATSILWGFRDSTLEVIIPTSHGSINVFCYSSKRDYPANKEEFVRIIRSLHLQPPFVYEKSFFRDLPLVDRLFREYRINGVLIALFISMLIVARVRAKKVKSNTAE